MTLEATINSWLVWLGGITGALFVLYMILMVYFNRKKDKDIQELRKDIAELKGILQGFLLSRKGRT